MAIENFDAVLYATTFLVPGFVWSTVLSMLYPRRSRALELRMLEFLTLSCINHGPWLWLLIPIFRSQLIQDRPYFAGLLLMFPVFVSPILLGLLTGHFYQQDRIKHVLVRFGFRTIHPIPTAWDFLFSRNKPYWVIIRLKDGALIYGLFGYNSFASDDHQERDLYVESLYRPDPNGDWVPVQDSGGIIVKAEQIVAIEFRKLSEVNYERP